MPKKTKAITELYHGQRCPKCGVAMARRRHDTKWKPGPRQPHWFVYWDVCLVCKRTQHYEKAKRFASWARKDWVPEKKLDLAHLADLRERGLIN